MLFTVLSLLAAAALTPLGYRRWPRAAAWIPVGLSAALFLGFAAQVPGLARGEVASESHRWVPELGVVASFALDGLSGLFALLVTGVGALILAYSISYVGHGPKLGRFLGLLLLFSGSMLGLVLAGDAITLFVFWELTSVSSFFLIAFDESAAARGRAVQALVVTSGGGLALLVGLLLFGAAGAGAGVAPGEAYLLSSLAEVDVRDHGSYVAIVLLVALGAFTKSAQVPFHFWLPGAMVAPSPVSAYLHSATMVKAGVYLLARLNPSLGETLLWTALLSATGAVTLVTGAGLAVLQRDLKLTFAYTTVAVLGALTLLIGLGTSDAIAAFAILLLAHALYKAALFLVAGIVGQRAASRDPFALTGLAPRMPATALAALFAAAGMAGLPPLLGFAGKEGLLLAALGGPAALLVSAAAFVGAALLVTAALVAVTPFLRRGPAPSGAREAPGMAFAPLLLGALGLVLGLLAGQLATPLVAPAAWSVAGRLEPVEVALWHGIAGAHGVALLLGLLGIAAGALLYLALARRPPPTDLLPAPVASEVYARANAGLARASTWLATTLQSGLLRRYLLITISFAGAAIGAPLLLELHARAPSFSAELRFYELLLVGIAAAGAVYTAIARDRLAAIAALGVSGLAIAFLFALFSAPDLAITQLMVETLMVILLVLVFRRLPPAVTHWGARRRAYHAAAVGVGGAVLALLLLAAAAPRFSPEASQFYLEQAPAEHADNLVNAILVNFRALDTLGEILVLAVAGLGVHSLLRLGARGKRAREER